MLRAHLRQTPDDAKIHALMAQVVSRLGRHDEALQHLARACELAPGNADLRFQLACLLAHEGRLQDALPHFHHVAQHASENAEVWHLLGTTLARMGKSNEARTALHNALTRAPSHPRALHALAQLEFQSGFPDDALPLWQRLLAAQPGDLDTRLKTGETLSRLGRPDEAARIFETGLKQTPDSADLWMALGQAEEDDGNREAAEHAFDRALSLRPGWAFPLAGRLGLGRAKAPDHLVEEARERLARGGLPDAEVAQLGYDLGKVMDARGEHAIALRYWSEANAARQRQIGTPDIVGLGDMVRRTIAAAPLGLFERGDLKGSDDSRPVFIVGMPRSGTTLTEQIIASHPLAHGCGELPDITLVARKLGSLTGTHLGWPESLATVTNASLATGAARYLAAATRNAPEGAQRLVDKAPLNFFLLGLIALLFPSARVIWCRRDPRDIAVSIYGENFALDETRATSMEAIAHYIGAQEALMRYWRDTLQLPILELRYETLVTELDDQSRRIIDFIGLPWDPACLEFYRSERGVQTPSRWQVRQPAHTRSIGRWRHYADAVAPILDILGPEAYRVDNLASGVDP